MSQLLRLAHERILTIPNSDLSAEVVGNQVSFTYRGLSNDPVDDQFLLFQTDFDFERRATLLGDGFQMLAQTTGTYEDPVDIGRCPDNSSSYRLYASKAPKRYYNYLVVEDSLGYALFGFTSCHRFAGYFTVSDEDGRVKINAYIDGEQTAPQDWSTNRLESVVVLRGESLSELYLQYSRLIQGQHPVRKGVTQDSPLGWCSWYAYYAEVTEKNIHANVEQMREHLKPFDYVLLDDGYQAFMGDWLTPSDKFPSGIKSVLREICSNGKKPAIWLAPFIAQPESEIFRNHPDWFVRHEDGRLLKAEDVTYAGWRCTPWYILDTTNIQVQEHLTRVVRTMREEWGVEMFKLDANYWGTLKGVRSQSGVTGVEAYRLGMQAIIEGAGDALVLGCNAPMWPSLGLVDAMRVSDDVERCATRFEQIAKETFYRSWQHRKLWQIDPDCATFVSLANQATERKYYEFHRDALLASGGLLLSGDPLPELTPFAKKTLAKLTIRHRHNQEAARFTALNLHHAFLQLTERNDLHCLFNYQNTAREVTLTANFPVYWYDYWTGEKLVHEPTQVLEVGFESGLFSRAIITSL
ncbi:alpha-galactosidase [Vibrio europaeus]|uniref:Alpha-galactosidase n=1 Tax=Vibrio europaeus TaxID=300876 RepID=A0A178JER4_9VIBR|nr:alpha-galactosidase [Vibrio europaeus]MDC5703775.1 alpha-galactosidase [Vibrio europaeus]MDC5708271.1 alpha-galactosidase [Vibrio europaeus]MDC5714322.1 alpha-galactosidase [Vibrio europaeus]MDC5847126.1 alpha-galactosidase [Vibrio europaeus]MDC5861893.1 alpha-galactosidase [Vibrio europaeus]